MKRNAVVFLLVLMAVLVAAKFSSWNRPAASAGQGVAESAEPVNLPAEIARAASEKKLLLLEFGSSDSCPPCTRFEKEVFSKPEFLAYEKSNLVFLRLDFPLKTDLPPQVKDTNVFLARQFEAFAFPTFVALDENGKEFWRMPRKEDSEPALSAELFIPKHFIALLESVKKKGQ